MRLTNVSFRYTRRGPWVLREVGLDLRPGEIVEVTGRNGAGKSTLLKMLAGALRPTTGSVTGRPAVVGYAPETFPVEQPFTVAAYLAAMARIRGVRDGLGDLPERLGMTALLGQPLRDLSKGSAHKVGLAQALLPRPGLLILDEPFAGLDTHTMAELPVIIAEVAAASGIVVVSDHQGGLRGVPSVRPVSVAGHAVAAGRHVSTSIVEVLVESTRAQEVAAKLRAEGYEARVRGGTTEPPPDEPTLTTEPPPDEPTLTTEPAATTEPTLTIEPPRGGPTRGEPPLDEPVPTEPKPPSQDPPSTAAGRPGDSYPTAALPQAARPAPGPSGSVADAVREGER